ncbi:Uncharacterized protein DBV15_05042 [Temnothorax longispinosus]|uniref:Uncharacterized protein n=1 Tax=Temnothorax longispinosus TaxID=300112 RepID=A0A4S2KQE6_9HYME|nr:Uncharacterized protein DBV15_05042 [Temnothorax longispinosus]
MEKKNVYHYEMQKCHPAQETLINETCALPKFLCRDCHLYQRIAEIHPRRSTPKRENLMAREKEDHEFRDRWKDPYQHKRSPRPISMRKRTSYSYNHTGDQDWDSAK